MLERTAFDWKNLTLMKEGGTILEFKYPLPPKFFLKIAKEDLRERSDRGLVNALSNAKRAIDCQSDTFLSAIGLSPKDVQKQLGKTVISSLEQFVTNTEQPLKFRVLESLGIVTPAIVSRVRRIRNLLEHQYKKPSAPAVRDVIDVSSLYVSACEGAMNTFLESVHFEVDEPSISAHKEKFYERNMSVELDWKRPQIAVNYWNQMRRERAHTTLKPKDDSYLAWLRVLFALRAEDEMEKAIAMAASLSGYPLEAKNIKIKAIELG